MVKIKNNIRVNDRIRTVNVRLIGVDGQQLGVTPISKARDLARDAELDLVEVAPGAEPPVCRIMDFKKFKYEQEKKEREAKKHQKQIHVKEIRIKPNIDEHDYQVKLRHLKEFLKKKDKVKLSLVFRGREMAHQDLAKRVLDRMLSDIQSDGQVEKEPLLEGRTMTTVIMPK
ncbi:MAG: translation initiation factor IF-3 [Candidatus Omnitrophota bacterium]